MITLREIMSRHFEVLGPQDPIQAALRKMDALNLVMLPVCEEGRLVGVLSSGEASRRLRAEDRPADPVTVGDLMSTDVLTGHEGENVQEVVPVMRRRGIPLLPIVDTERHLLGVFSLGGPWRRAARRRFEGGEDAIAPSPRGAGPSRVRKRR
jgi:CBS domain-containing protein